MFLVNISRWHYLLDNFFILLYGSLFFKKTKREVSSKMGFIDQIDFKKGDGLVPVIVQDHETNDVLMMAYMNEAALQETLELKKACFYSRSRQKFWVKGESSGNFQEVKDIFFDCDNDTILLKINQVGGAACHTGHRTCFYKQVIDNDNVKEVGELVFDPKEVYGE